MTGCIRLLDCTLRDGGYVNDWNFGNGTMTCIYDRLTSAGVDIIEIGFLDDRREFDIERSIQPDTQSLMKAYANVNPKKAMVVAMIDYGTCSIDHVEPREKTFLDGIRVIFKKENMYNAADFGKQLIDKGYKVFLQLVSVTDYEEKDIKALAKYIRPIMPMAVSIVDTYGLMHKEQVFRYFQLLDKYLPKGIGIGYHSHNNFQLAYSNTIELLNLDTKRDIVLDGTLYGMGKSAGNAPIELLAMHLNDRCGKNYDLNQILEAISNEIMPIYHEHYWGYNLFFYVAAKNDCHPNYVKYLLDKMTLSVKDVNVILERIEPEHKLRYDADYIETLYGEYIFEIIDDRECIDSLKDILSGKDVLLLGPGTSVISHKSDIKRFVKKNSPIAISTNFVPEEIPIDFVFISNPIRYSMILPDLANTSIKVIGTSNVTAVDKPFDYTVRYDALISQKSIWDNSLAILLNLLRKIGVGKVALAGFDGFKKNVEDNYIDTDFDLSKQYSYLSSVNRCMTKMIKDMRKSMDIEFVTESIYEGTQ